MSMKKKTIPSQAVTKTYFKKELKKELTKFATKKDLEATEKSLKSDIRLSILMSEDRMELKIEQKLTKFRDSIITAIDPLLAEVEQRQQDRELASDQTARLRSQLENHEGRIQILEQTQL